MEGPRIVAAVTASEVGYVDESRYVAIEEYGVVGSVAWRRVCSSRPTDRSTDSPFPHVESPSVLGAILDAEDGGRFRINPVGPSMGNRESVERTNGLENGYDEELEAFVQSYGSDTVDATGLLLPVVGFLPFEDERMRDSIDAIERRPGHDEVLVRRYDGDDDLPGSEGAFVLRSFPDFDRTRDTRGASLVE